MLMSIKTLQVIDSVVQTSNEHLYIVSRVSLSAQTPKRMKPEHLAKPSICFDAGFHIILCAKLQNTNMSEYFCLLLTHLRIF